MGDAMVGVVLQSFKSSSWCSIRNASDPQIPNPNHDIEEASKQSALIYAKYGGLTTAASLIAAWAIIEAEARRPARRTGHDFTRLQARAATARTEEVAT